MLLMLLTLQRTGCSATAALSYDVVAYVTIPADGGHNSNTLGPELPASDRRWGLLVYSHAWRPLSTGAVPFSFLETGRGNVDDGSPLA
jgi:hypothetical protein